MKTGGFMHMVLSVDVDRWPDSKLEGLLRDTETGHALTATEVRAVCADYRARGFEAIPSCDNHDAKGRCLGHQRKADA